MLSSVPLKQITFRFILRIQLKETYLLTPDLIRINWFSTWRELNRKPFSEQDREFIFRREQGQCKRCGHQLVFGNRRRDQKGAWEMGHRRSHAGGGTSHLKNIVALCWKCNLEQGTTSYAQSERGMEYDTRTDKAKSILNKHLLGDELPSFNLSGAKRSRSMDAELNEFRIKVQTNSRDWVNKTLKEIFPLAKRFENTRDPSYEKYLKMYQIIDDIGRKRWSR